MAITTTERDQIIKLVVGMFNAAPGATYLNTITSIYEANGHNLTALAQTLSGTSVFQAMYPSFQTSTEFATSFLSQFGLQTNQTAIDYIVARVNAGVNKGEIILNAIVLLDGINSSVGGQIGAAAAQLDNKAAVATYYSVDKAVAQTDIAQLQNAISGVTSDAATVTSAKANIDNGGSSVAQFLSQNQDTLTGGAGNDLFTANLVVSGTTTIETLQSFDSISGGDGTDTLNVTLFTGAAGGNVAPTISGVENVLFRSTGTDTLDLANASGVTTLSVSGSTTAATVNNVKAVANLAVSNQNQDTTFGGSTAATINLRVDTVGSNATGGAVQKNVTVANTTGTSLNVTANNANVQILGATALTTATIAATGTARVNLASAATTLTSLTTSGTGLVNTSDTSLTALKTLTAGDGGVTFTNAGSTAATFTATTGAGKDTLTLEGNKVTTVSTGAGNDTVTLANTAVTATSTFDLGAGDDTISFVAAPTAGATANGGDGTDTIGFTAAGYGTVSAYTTAQLAKLTNFEVLSITDAATTGTYDVSKIVGATSFTFAGGIAAGNTATVTNLGANATVTIAGAATTGAAVLTLKSDTAADVLNLVLKQAFVENNDATATNNAFAQNVTATGIETLNVNSSGTPSTAFLGNAGTLADKVTNTLTLTDTSLKALTITGDQALVYATGAGPTVLATVDGSANTGGINFDASGLVATGVAMAITGSATAANTLTGAAKADTIVGGAKADTITGGQGGDTLTGGAGNDTFVFNAAQESTLANLDTITDFTANTFGNGTAGAAGTGATGVAAASLTGDVLSFDVAAAQLAVGVKLSVQANASDATTYLQNIAADATANEVGAALDSSTGRLYLDLDSNGTADSVIVLTGVTTLTAAAINLF